MRTWAILSLLSIVITAAPLAAQRDAGAAAPFQLSKRPMPAGTDLNVLLPPKVGAFARGPLAKDTRPPVDEDLNVDYVSGKDTVNVGFSIPGSARDAQEAIRTARTEAIATLKQAGRAQDLKQAQEAIGGATSYYRVGDFVAWSRGGYFYYAKANSVQALEAFMGAFPF